MTWRRLAAAVAACGLLLCGCTKQETLPPKTEPDSDEESTFLENDEELSHTENLPADTQSTDAPEPERATDAAFTPEELEEFRLSIPYGGIAAINPGQTLVSRNSDEITRELAAFIQPVLLFTKPQESFSSPADEAAQAFIIRSSFFNTADVYLIMQEQNPEMTQYILQALRVDLLTPKEHVEQTARVLFGDKVVLDHGTLDGAGGMCQYYSELGYYGATSFGLGGAIEPVIVSMQEYENRYELEVAFLFYDPEDGYSYEGQPVTLDDYDELMRFCREETERHAITLMKRDDGSVYYYAHTLP